MAAQNKTENWQIQADDMKSPETLRRVLNDNLALIARRLDELSAVNSVRMELLPDVTFDTGASVAAGAKPFDGSLRVSCAFTPRGVSLLRLERVRPAGQPVLTNASDVKWRFLSGPNQGGVVVIDFVSGLATNSTYVMRLGVARG